jgi:hypothetical protein
VCIYEVRVFNSPGDKNIESWFISICTFLWTFSNKLFVAKTISKQFVSEASF